MVLAAGPWSLSLFLFSLSLWLLAAFFLLASDRGNCPTWLYASQATQRIVSLHAAPLSSFLGVLGLGSACRSLFTGYKQRLHSRYLWVQSLLGVVAPLCYAITLMPQIYRPFHTVVSALLTTDVKKL